MNRAIAAGIAAAAVAVAVVVVVAGGAGAALAARDAGGAGGSVPVGVDAGAEVAVLGALEEAVAAGRWLEARRLAPAAIAAAPMSGRIQHAAAWAALAAQDLPGAEEAARRALTRLPSWPPAHELLARILIAQGREADAAAVLDEVARHAPGRPETIALVELVAQHVRLRTGERRVPPAGVARALDGFLAHAQADLAGALGAALDVALLRRLAAAAGAGSSTRPVADEVAAGLRRAAADAGVRVLGFEVAPELDADGRARARLLLERLPSTPQRAAAPTRASLVGLASAPTAEELREMAPGLARGGHVWTLELAAAITDAEGGRVTALAIVPDGAATLDVETALAPMVGRPSTPLVAPVPATGVRVPRPGVLALALGAVALFLTAAIVIARRR